MDGALISAAAAATLAVLVSAAVSDWRKREASDVHWGILMAVGTVLFCIRIRDGAYGPEAYLMPVSMVLMGIDLVWDREVSPVWDAVLYAGILATAVAPAIALWGEEIVWVYLSVPAVYVLMNVLYYLGIVRGGADAKSVISVAFVFPSYPDMGAMPLLEVPSGNLPYLAVPAFSVFFLAALMTVFLVIPYLAVNIIRHDIRFPHMFTGFRMDIDRVKDSHVWPMEDVNVDGLVSYISGIDDPDALERLRSHGARKIWVTPIIPFLVPIAMSYAIVIFIGNPLFLII